MVHAVTGIVEGSKGNWNWQIRPPPETACPCLDKLTSLVENDMAARMHKPTEKEEEVRPLHVLAQRAPPKTKTKTWRQRQQKNGRLRQPSTDEQGGSFYFEEEQITTIPCSY